MSTDQIFRDLSHYYPDQSPNIHIIGNLPFSVARRITFKIFNEILGKKFAKFRSENIAFTFMYQREVAESIVASNGSKNRSRLSVIAQTLCDVKLLYIVPSTVFVPKPKVDAGIVQFKPRNTDCLGKGNS